MMFSPKIIYVIVIVVAVVGMAIFAYLTLSKKNEGYEEIRGGILDRTETFNGQNVKYTTLRELQKKEDEFDPLKGNGMFLL